MTTPWQAYLDEALPAVAQYSTDAGDVIQFAIDLAAGQGADLTALPKLVLPWGANGVYVLSGDGLAIETAIELDLNGCQLQTQVDAVGVQILGDDAAGTVVRNGSLGCVDPGTQDTGVGIYVSADSVVLSDLTVRDQDIGIQFYAVEDDPAFPSAMWARVSRIRTRDNLTYGVYIVGELANGGVFQGIDSVGDDTGLADASDVGNLHIGHSFAEYVTLAILAGDATFSPQSTFVGMYVEAVGGIADPVDDSDAEDCIFTGGVGFTES